MPDEQRPKHSNKHKHKPPVSFLTTPRVGPRSSRLGALLGDSKMEITENISIKQLSQEYIRKHNHYVSERNKIDNRIEQREKQIKRLEKKQHSLSLPSWIEEILEPIAKAMIRKMPDRYYDILGPFGMCCTTSIHFYKSGVGSKQLFDGDNCRSITFRPKNLDVGEVVLVDYNQDTGRYAKGTMGEVNGMNHPELPIKDSINELMKFMNREKLS